MKQTRSKPPVFIGKSWTLEIKNGRVYATDAVSATTYTTHDGKTFSGSIHGSRLPEYVKTRMRSMWRKNYRKTRRNGSKKYRLKSARSVARRLRLHGMKKFRTIARRSRKNCGCKKRSR